MQPLELLKRLYKEKFNIDSVIVDLMADRDILHLTASGSSFYTISNFLDIDIKEVKKVNKKFYGFRGWKRDLDLNPLAIYNNMSKYHIFEYEVFNSEIRTLSPYFVDAEIDLMFEVCTKFYTIEKLLEEEWN